MIAWVAIIVIGVFHNLQTYIDLLFFSFVSSGVVVIFLNSFLCFVVILITCSSCSCSWHNMINRMMTFQHIAINFSNSDKYNPKLQVMSTIKGCKGNKSTIYWFTYVVFHKSFNLHFVMVVLNRINDHFFVAQYRNSRRAWTSGNMLVLHVLLDDFFLSMSFFASSPSSLVAQVILVLQISSCHCHSRN
jgi:hypothetical protein